MRALIFELRPGNVEENGLIQALRTHSAALSGPDRAAGRGRRRPRGAAADRRARRACTGSRRRRSTTSSSTPGAKQVRVEVGRVPDGVHLRVDRRRPRLRPDHRPRRPPRPGRDAVPRRAPRRHAHRGLGPRRRHDDRRRHSRRAAGGGRHGLTSQGTRRVRPAPRRYVECRASTGHLPDCLLRRPSLTRTGAVPHHRAHVRPRHRPRRCCRVTGRRRAPPARRRRR